MKGKMMMKPKDMPMKGKMPQTKGCDMMAEMDKIAKGKMKRKGTQLHKGMK